MSEERKDSELIEAPPLCLRDYLKERDGAVAAQLVKEPSTRANVVERIDNLIILEFDEIEDIQPRRPRSKSRWYDAGVLLLLIFCIAAIVSSFLK